MLDNNTTPPDGTFSQLMSMQERVPDDVAAPARAKIDSNEDTKKSSNLQRKESRKLSSKNASKIYSNEERKERTDQVRYTGSEGDEAYTITLPGERQKKRASFDVFADQQVALVKLQLAAVDVGEKRPKLGEMIQEGIDLYIKRRARQLPNVRLHREAGE